jgi:AcrR family transcriptional regulator
MSIPAKKRAYHSTARTQAADETRRRILAAAKSLFGRRGIDAVTIAEIGAKARVAASTVYAIYKSKDGILRALMEQTLFGDQFRAAEHRLEGATDPVQLIERTARVARAIYDSESRALGLLRHVSGFSAALRKIELEFERKRYEMQKPRLQRLFEAGLARDGLSLDEARRIMWMYTSREVYRLLVHDSHWTPQRYEQWLAQTLLEALVARDGSSRDLGKRR